MTTFQVDLKNIVCVRLEYYMNGASIIGINTSKNKVLIIPYIHEADIEAEIKIINEAIRKANDYSKNN